MACLLIRMDSSVSGVWCKSAMLSSVQICIKIVGTIVGLANQCAQYFGFEVWAPKWSRLVIEWLEFSPVVFSQIHPHWIEDSGLGRITGVLMLYNSAWSAGHVGARDPTNAG